MHTLPPHVLAGIPPDWLGVDMHVHSHHSDGFPTVEKILERAKRRGIGVAITDHNTIAGSIEASEKAGEGIVIPGIEVSSDQNVHMLCYFSTPSDLESFFLRAIEPFKQKRFFCKSIGLPVAEILEAVKECSGIAALAHPYGNGHFGRLAEATRERLLDLFDGIEICNGVQSNRRNEKAYALAKRGDFFRIGGSDAHVACACGQVCTFAPAEDPSSFLHSLRRGVSVVFTAPFSLRNALEDGMVIALRYAWHALHPQRLWT